MCKSALILSVALLGAGFDGLALAGGPLPASQKLMGPAPASGTRFGCSIAVGGDTAAIGAFRDALYDRTYGRVSVFSRSGAAWVSAGTLGSNQFGMLDGFGAAVAVIDDDSIATGAHLDDESGASAGAVFIHERIGAAWVRVAKLVPSDPPFVDHSFDRFGSAVAASGESMVVGAPNDDGVNLNAGAAHVFRRTGGGWIAEGSLRAPPGGGSPFALFGSAVDIDGDRIVVGAPQEDAEGLFAGRAYVFRRSGEGVWALEQVLSPPIGSDFARFGTSVAIRGGVLAVGAPSDLARDSGQRFVNVYEETPTGWSLAAALSDPKGYGAFGQSVAIGGGLVVVGAAGDARAGFGGPGSVHVFAKPFETWILQVQLGPDDLLALDAFGIEVAGGEDFILAGASQGAGEFSLPGVTGVLTSAGVSGFAGGTGTLTLGDPNGSWSQPIDGSVSFAGDGAASARAFTSGGAGDDVNVSPGVNAAGRLGGEVADSLGPHAAVGPFLIEGAVRRHERATLTDFATSGLTVPGATPTTGVGVFSLDAGGIVHASPDIAEQSGSVAADGYGESEHDLSVIEDDPDPFDPDDARLTFAGFTPKGAASAGMVAADLFAGSEPASPLYLGASSAGGGEMTILVDPSDPGSLPTNGFGFFASASGESAADVEINVVEDETPLFYEFLLLQGYGNAAADFSGVLNLDDGWSPASDSVFAYSGGFDGEIAVSGFAQTPVRGVSKETRTLDLALAFAGDLDLAGTAAGDDSSIGSVYVFPAPPPLCVGDADRDGAVDFGDITKVLENWLVEYFPRTGPGDANYDGRVNFGDISKVLTLWGVPCL